MTKRKFEIRKQSILPGFESGCFEPKRAFDPNEFVSSLEEGMRRDNRVSVRVSGKDLSALKRRALDEGLPLQTLLANILHQYAKGELREVSPAEGLLPGAVEDSLESSDLSSLLKDFE